MFRPGGPWGTTRRMFLRHLGQAALLATFVGGVGACRSGTSPTPSAAEQVGQTPAPQPTPTAPQQAGQTGVVLDFYHDKVAWSDSVDAMGQLAREAIGIGFRSIPYPDTTTYQATVRQSLSTDRPPDLFFWYSGFRLEDVLKSGEVVDLSDIWKKYLDSKQYNPDIPETFRYKDGIYAVPMYMTYYILFYHKPVFERLQLTTPKTWDEFIRICETLKANGVIPMAQTINERWPAMLLFQELIIRSAGPDFYNALMLGQASYEDPEVVTAMDLWGEMIQKGYFTDPGIAFGTTVDTLLPLFSEGRVGMIPIGDWYQSSLLAAGLKPGVDYDVMIMPNVHSDLPPAVIIEFGPLLVSRRSPNREAALQIIDWWLSAEAQQAWTEQMGFTPPNTAVQSTNPVTANLKNLLERGNYRLVQQFWDATPPEIVEPAVDEFAKFILNPQSGPAVRAAIQQVATQTWRARGGQQ